MKIALWSPTRFSGRKSANVLLLAMQAIAEDGGEQLIVHMDPKGSGPEHFMLSGRHRSRMMEQKEFGVEFLCKLLNCERFTKDAVRNAAYTFVDGKLHILPAGDGAFYERKETPDAIIGMLQAANKEFQNVWIELPAGNLEKNKPFFAEADCVIVNLAQSPYETELITGLPRFENVFYIVGAYEQRNIYTVHNMMLLFPKLRGRCAAFPYHPSFSEACCAGDAERFLRRGAEDAEDKVFPFFFRETEKTYRKWKEGCDRTSCGEKGHEIRTDRNL